MVETVTQSVLIAWDAPQCPFRIAYAAQVLDDIRLAVVDAFFSLPRGGAEIGGILLGRFEDDRVAITGYAALDCEHATGPSFTLSSRDEEKLRELLARAPAEFPGLLPVGWYHSHTRSAIFLSEADLDIHHRYFPEPWQVALVMKPHTFEPTRAGFFFRETAGTIHASESYQEIAIEALPMRPVPAGGSGDLPKPEGRVTATRLDRNPAPGLVTERAAEALQSAPQPLAEPIRAEPKREQPETESPVDLPVPQFLSQPPVAVYRWGVAILAICGLVALAGVAYETYGSWLPKVMAAVRPTPVAQAAPNMGLNAIDREGQLQINWNRNSPAVRRAVKAILEISDGATLAQAVTLDPAHLQNGLFSYGRQSERVDVKLILHQRDGQQFREVTTFLGKLPDRKPPEEDPEVRKQREQMAAEAAKLKTDLDTQAARTRKLERDLKSIKDEMKNQQQRRLTNQLPEGKQN